jgi:ribosomal protein S14
MIARRPTTGGFPEQMTDCAERDSLVAEFESAIDQYVQAANEISATGNCTAKFHANLQLSRQRLRDHCQQHGCRKAQTFGR